MVSIQLNGRFGNQLFQYSVCRIVAFLNNYKFHIPSVGQPSTEGIHIKDFFDNLDLGEVDGELKVFWGEDIYSQKFDEKVLRLPNFTNIYGFFQTPKYFEGHEDLVRSWFTIKPTDKFQEIFSKYPPKDYCYIHVRASDYKNHLHWFLDKNYYNSAIQYIKKYNPNTKFVIITDDIEESKNILPDIDAISNDLKTDFLLLLNSNLNIISNSTFSWWAAWLKRKEIVIAPNNWLNYNRPDLGFYPKDIKTEGFIYL